MTCSRSSSAPPWRRSTRASCCARWRWPRSRARRCGSCTTSPRRRSTRYRPGCGPGVHAQELVEAAGGHRGRRLHDRRRPRARLRWRAPPAGDRLPQPRHPADARRDAGGRHDARRRAQRGHPRRAARGYRPASCCWSPTAGRSGCTASREDWCERDERKQRGRRRHRRRPQQPDRAGLPRGGGPRGRPSSRSSRNVGGNTVTEELTLPGFRHHSCSSAHVLIQSNPVIRDDELGLTQARPALRPQRSGRRPAPGRRRRDRACPATVRRPRPSWPASTPPTGRPTYGCSPTGRAASPVRTPGGTPAASTRPPLRRTPPTRRCGPAAPTRSSPNGSAPRRRVTC